MTERLLTHFNRPNARPRPDIQDPQRPFPLNRGEKQLAVERELEDVVEHIQTVLLLLVVGELVACSQSTS